MLWCADGTSLSATQDSSHNAAGLVFLIDGGSFGASSSSSSRIFTLSSNWSTTIKFAIEATMESQSSSYQANSALWDFTAGTIISGSTIISISSSFSTIRSSQFALIPGHTYGVTFWVGSGGTSSYIANICDASLIVFG